ncbi:MAG: hypothetical protein M0C28_06460 [Candidatus Moduliflexus flocculans]|nr:hypothetical protein [Candidatus Moduliflexus flocculans]
MTLVLRKLLASSTFAIAGALESIVQPTQGQAADRQEPAESLERRAGSGLRSARRNGRGMDRGRAAEAALRSRPRGHRAGNRRPRRLCRSSPPPSSHNAKGKALLKALEIAFAKAGELGAAREGDHLYRIAHAPRATCFASARGQSVRRGHRPVQRLEHRRPIQRDLRRRGWSATQGTDRVTGSRSGRHALRAGGLLPRAGPHHDRHRSRRGGHQPPVLLPGGELRPALEPAAHRAAHRPLPPLRPAARRGRGELPQPQERGRPARLRAAVREVPALRGRLRRQRRGAGRHRVGRGFREAHRRHLPALPQARGDPGRLRSAPA